MFLSFLPGPLRRRALLSLAWLRYRRYHSGIRPQAANIRERLGVSALEAERILRRSFELELAAISDGARLRAVSAHDVDSVIAIEGLERLERALQAGRGAVLTTGHVAGLTAFFTALGVLGYQPNLIRLRARREKGAIARWWYERYNRRLAQAGCTNLWMEPGGFAVGVRGLNALRRNQVVISPIDLSQSDDNAIVTFFGSPAEMPRGMAILAKIGNAPLLDFFVHRGSDGRLVATIGEPIAVEDLDSAVQHSAGLLEAHVRRHPSDWSPWHIFDDWRRIGNDDSVN